MPSSVGGGEVPIFHGIPQAVEPTASPTTTAVAAMAAHELFEILPPIPLPKNQATARATTRVIKELGQPSVKLKVSMIRVRIVIDAIMPTIGFSNWPLFILSKFDSSFWFNILSFQNENYNTDETKK